jgi:DNA-directed RNA polymerase specialized sigma24 family protein
LQGLSQTLTQDVLADARDWKPAALEAVLAAGYAPARRIAHALSGDDAVGRAVAELLIRRSLRMLPRWLDPSSAENWFYHHAVLTTRSADVPPPADPLQDPLVVHGPADRPAYVAFVRALRLLPSQQREAFILHHGERLNARMLGVAMDCSMQAADTHLQAATETLRTVSEGSVEPQAAELTRAYTALQAAQPDAAPRVRVYVRHVRRRLLLQRVMRVLIVALLLAGLGVLGWMFRDELIRLMRPGG